MPIKSKLPPLVSFLVRWVSFLSRRFSFLSRITEAFSMAYVTRKKPVMCNDCCSAVLCQIEGTESQKIHVCIDALIICSIHIKQTSNVRSDNYFILGTEFHRVRTRLFLTTSCEKKEIVHRNSQVRFKISINYKKSYMRFNSCDHAWVQRVDFANLAQCE